MNKRKLPNKVIEGIVRKFIAQREVSKDRNRGAKKGRPFNLAQVLFSRLKGYEEKEEGIRGQ